MKRVPSLEDRDRHSRSRSEEERQKRRREWMIQREREREHERLKQKKILEYELKRARELAKRFKRRSRSKSRSKSSESHHGRSVPSSSRIAIMSEKLDSSGSANPIFKGPEGTQISASELRRIKVDIHRNIPSKEKSGELQRDIVNPEDVIIKRRTGEGAKPIFEREELKATSSKVEEVEEHRTVKAVESGHAVSNRRPVKLRSVSLSPQRGYSRSPRPTSSQHSRDKYRSSVLSDHRTGCRSDRNRSKERSRESEKKSRKQSTKRIEFSRERCTSRSEDRNQRKREHSSYRSNSPREERSHRERRSSSRTHFQERRQRGRSSEHRIAPAHYIEQVPYPVYYGDFPPRPIMMGPVMPMRARVPISRTRFPPPIPMGLIRPYLPRFIPADMYRQGAPPNRFGGPMY